MSKSKHNTTTAITATTATAITDPTCVDVAGTVARFTTDPAFGIAWAGLWAGLNAIRDVVPDRKTPIPADTITRAVDAGIAVCDRPDTGAVRTGRFTNMAIMAFQNAVYVRNADPAWRFSDAVLTVAWGIEFPHAACRFTDTAWIRGYVGTTRSDYNRGRHGCPVPVVPSVAYRRDGSPMRATADTTATAKTA